MATRLSDDDKATISRLTSQIWRHRRQVELLDAYYEGTQRLEHIGIAVPPELRRFETVVNVPRMAVDEPEHRQGLKGFQRSGKFGVDRGLQEGWEYNNLDSQSSLAHKDARTHGRAFVTVSTNADDAEQPLITIEPVAAFGVEADTRQRRFTSALRLYKDPVARTTHCTLYQPEVTRWLRREGAVWVDEEDPDEHQLGRLPVVMLRNRPRTGRLFGVSEMADVMKLADAIARMVTNMQVAGEALAVPHRWATGLKKDDFVDKKGRPVPVWEAYLTVMKMSQNPNAKFGSFVAADLKNFTDAVDSMMAWCASVLGLPTRYAGQQSVNPATEGAIRADEARLIKNVERMNTHDGAAWSWVQGIRERFTTGEWPANNSIRALWFDPATPTISQRADATLKLYQGGVLSREGTWDELGWDEPRKDRERAYFDAEARDPLLDKIGATLGRQDAVNDADGGQ